MIKKITVLLLCMPNFVCAESFVINKKSAKVSVTDLKSQCGDSCAAILNQCADVTQELAQLQKEILVHSQQMIDGDKDVFFATNDKDALKECSDKLQACHKMLQSVGDQVAKYKKYVAELE